MNEWGLRDLIARDIGKLKPGLTLIKKEQYIPNEHGTRSFIDLYARDEKGRHVLIELKRSDAAARQAIHEVTKYVESVKQYFGAKDTEIHVIIASEQWRELFIPFSRFAADTGFSIEGIEVAVAEDESDFQVSPVEPMRMEQGRFIAPWHHVYWYADKDALEQGLRDIEAAYARKGIRDYVIVKLYLQNRQTPEERRAAMRAALAKMTGVDESEVCDVPEVPVHEYIAYTALQMLPKERCLKLLARNRELLAEVREELEELEEEEALGCLHENLEVLEPRPKPDYYEIGYPAKFDKLTKAENCTVCGLVRYGTFRRNPLLDDGIICSELRGEDGATGQKLKMVLQMRDAAHVKKLKEDLSSTLEDNPVWKNHLLRIVDEISSAFPDSEVEVWVFNPCMGVFTAYYAATREDGYLYIPCYHVIVRDPHDVRFYFGALQESGTALSFPQILDKYYDGSLAALLTTATWGGRDPRDSDIVEDLGAQYRSYRMDFTTDGSRDFSVLRDEKWRRCDPVSSPFELFVRYAEHNKTLMRQIVGKLSPRDMGGLFQYISSDRELEQYVDTAAADRNREYYCGAPDSCDMCGCSFKAETYMVDGKVKGRGGWACMCGDCFIGYGEAIAWGYGQLYRREDDGWLLVGGFEH